MKVCHQAFHVNQRLRLLNHKVFPALLLLTSLFIHGKAVQAADNNDPQCAPIAWRTFSCMLPEMHALIADYLPGHETIVFIDFDDSVHAAKPHVQSLDFTEDPDRVKGLSDAILTGFTGLKFFRYLNAAGNELLSLPATVTDFAFQNMTKMTHLHTVGSQFTDAAIARMPHLIFLKTNEEELTGEDLTEVLRLIHIRDGAGNGTH